MSNWPGFVDNGLSFLPFCSMTSIFSFNQDFTLILFSLLPAVHHREWIFCFTYLPEHV